MQLEGPITVIVAGPGVSTAFAPLLLRDNPVTACSLRSSCRAPFCDLIAGAEDCEPNGGDIKSDSRFLI